jgi:CRISPR-associated endonuclease/helicase Cas3
MAPALAHRGGAGGKDDPLVDHSRRVAARARTFAEHARPGDGPFAAMAAWAGWLHDLGKYRVEFQGYLDHRRPRGPDTQHAVFGAARASAVRLPLGVALAIAGHHAGLPSLSRMLPRFDDPALDPRGVANELARCLDADRGDNDPTWPHAVAEFLRFRRHLEAAYDQELLIRMLFSCLVDADYLDTESFMTGRERQAAALKPSELFGRLDGHVRRLGEGGEPTPVNRARRALYQACLAAAAEPRGCFRLTAPTGSGKTLAMMAFALRHAEAHGLRRVIVVLPFLTVIEQNARVYREALGVGAGSSVLIEHHSAVKEWEGQSADDESGAENETAGRTRAKQATENWDAPVVITTAVQFLESLFARWPRACRKLHNIARSVVIFDEVQTLPFPLLDPILSAVRDLRDGFGVSCLFGSATQPGLERSPNLPCGFAPGGGECHEIVAGDQDRTGLFHTFRRAALSLPCLSEPPWSWDDLAERLKEESQVLVIVNLRKHAQDLFDRLRSAGVAGLFHLSSTMCAAHRAEKLGRKEKPGPGTIYLALKTGAPCVVVSTQVVEAGVDLDFPVVFRAAGPLDAIIQAAGRCDRDGRRTRAAGRPAGRVVVFRPAAEPAAPPGFYAEATGQALRLLEEFASDPQRVLDDPAVLARYHDGLIARGEGRETARAVQAARKILDFDRVAELFRIIDDAGQGVVVRYGEAVPILDDIRRRRHVTADDYRALQRFTVNLFPTWVTKLQPELRPVLDREGAPLEFVGSYDPDLGLRLGELPPESFCVA